MKIPFSVLIITMHEYEIEGAIVFQSAKFRLLHNEKEIKLSQKETEVLFLLCQNAQHVVERKVFLHEIWDNREGGDISLNKSVLTLRRKFESLGYLNGIDTIPRVGYMLRLNALAIEVVATEPEVVNEQPEITSHLPAEGKTPSARYKRSLPYLFLMVAGFLSFLLYQLYVLYIGKEASPLAYKTAYESPSLTIIEMADLNQSVNYPAFTSRLPSDNRMQVSISNSAISLLGQRNGTQSLVRVFIHDHDKDINDQLTCIADYVTNRADFADEDTRMAHTASALENDETFQKKLFYSPCINGNSHYLGDVSTTLSYYSRDLPKATQPSSWIQNISFHDNSGKLVFSLQVIYRAVYLYEGKGVNKNNFLVRLNQRSIKIGHIDQNRIKNNSHFKMIFNEYEDDDIFVKLLASADGQNKTALSSIFDGILSHGLRKKIEP
ncbi:winged helix-turn-helix domain-containing protein [Aeromonas sobria]|uniref:winged helix-turn-helix domain-containing protein n=1 Tax=Aeromonas sobria TaxID=646 RepID=UPI003F3F6890